MARAIEAGLPKRRIEEAAARTQARIDSGLQTVIGVNTLPPNVEREINVLKVDAAEVRAMQIEKLKRLRAERDEGKTQAALEALTKRRARKRQPSATLGRRGARQGDGRRNLAGDGEGVRAPRRRDSGDLRACISPRPAPASEANERVLR